MRPGSKRRIAGSLVMLLLVGACGDRGGEGADCPSGIKQTTPSGYCIPRYLSLKRGEVFGRKGPGKDYPTVYVYHAKGLPVQVIDETSDWRRICDPDGTALWVASPMLDGRRTVMANGAAAVRGRGRWRARLGQVINGLGTRAASPMPLRTDAPAATASP
jgi:hypothetical protein